MTGEAAIAAAIANAVKASGAIVSVEPNAFSTIVAKGNDLLVVVAEGGMFGKHYQYLTSYKGLIFYTKSSQPLSLSRNTEVVAARKIWVPG